jgi:biotin synthase
MPSTTPIADGADLTLATITAWLRETDAAALAELFDAADRTRRRNVGDEVQLRGLIELSNHCRRQCAYCGIARDRKDLTRYRLDREQILECAATAKRLGYQTVVMQAGEDPAIRADEMAGIIREIKSRHDVAITLSLGERNDDEFQLWRDAGADRYLIRFETSDHDLYDIIHPSLPYRLSDRVAILKRLREIGYEIGSGVMIGLPGQRWEDLARDILLFRELDLDMIGVGPYLPHPDTPLGRGDVGREIDPDEQVPNTEEMTYKVVALTRLACPEANIPSTTALATINKGLGRELGLMRGANVVMPNVTPSDCRIHYEIYPAKACITESAEACFACMLGRIHALGRRVATGKGYRGGRNTRN